MTIPAFHHYVLDELPTIDAAKNAAAKINEKFNEVGVDNIIAHNCLERLQFKFDVLEHRAVLENLNRHAFDLAPILEQVREEAEQKRREKLGRFGRGLENFQNFIHS